MKKGKKQEEELQKQLKQETEEQEDRALTKEDLDGVAGAGRPGKHEPPS